MGNTLPIHSHINNHSNGNHGNENKVLDNKINDQNKKSIQITSNLKHYSLNISKDNSTQTIKSYRSTKTTYCNVINIFIVVVISYFAIYLAAIHSPYLQSLIVYMHYIRVPLSGLTNLHSFGLSNMARNIEIITEDGYILKGWHLMNPGTNLSYMNSLSNETEKELYYNYSLSQANRVIVYFHGNTATRGVHHRVETIKYLAMFFDAHVLTIDYRGFGDSQGYPSEEGTHLDGLAIIKYINAIVKEYKPDCNGYIFNSSYNDEYSNTYVSGGNISQISYTDEYDIETDIESPTTTATTITRASSSSSICKNGQPHLYLYGHSLGTAISTQLAMELNQAKSDSVTGLILDAPFTTMPDAGKSHPITAMLRIFPILFNNLIQNLHYKYPTIDRIAHVKAPVLILHGAKDRKVPYTMSQQLFNKVIESTTTTITVNTTTVTVISKCTALNSSCIYIPPTIIQQQQQQQQQQSLSDDDTIMLISDDYNITTRIIHHPVRYHRIPNMDHNDIYKSSEWMHLIYTFMNEIESTVT